MKSDQSVRVPLLARNARRVLENLPLPPFAGITVRALMRRLGIRGDARAFEQRLERLLVRRGLARIERDAGAPYVIPTLLGQVALLQARERGKVPWWRRWTLPRARAPIELHHADRKLADRNADARRRRTVR